MHREPRRWRTRFGSWVRDYGVRRLTSRLRDAGQPITDQAVYNWLSGNRTPRPESAVVMVSLSRGRVGLDDVYRHRSVIRGSGTTPTGK